MTESRVGNSTAPRAIGTRAVSIVSREFLLISHDHVGIKFYVTMRTRDESALLAVLNTLTDDRTTLVTMPTRVTDWAEPREMSEDEDGDDEMADDLEEASDAGEDE